MTGNVALAGSVVSTGAATSDAAWRDGMINTMKRILAIMVCCAAIFFCASMTVAEDISQEPTHKRVTDNQKKPSILNEQERQKLEEDAGKLSEDFRALFKDLSTISQKIAKALVDYIAEWIDTNYSQLSEGKKETLKQFLEKLEKDYKGLKDMSLQTLGRILKDFQELVEQLEKKESPQVEESSSENVHI